MMIGSRLRQYLKNMFIPFGSSILVFYAKKSLIAFQDSSSHLRHHTSLGVGDKSFFRLHRSSVEGRGFNFVWCAKLDD